MVPLCLLGIARHACPCGQCAGVGVDVFLAVGDAGQDGGRHGGRRRLACKTRDVPGEPCIDAAHDDPRGVLFFPDEPAVEADTYDAIVAETEAARRGLWIPKALLSSAERASRNATLSRDLEEAKRMVAALTGAEMTDEDAQRAVAMARGLSSGAPALATPFGAAKLLEDVQKQLMGAMGLASRPNEDTVVLLLRRTTELAVDEDEVVDAYLLEDGSVALETFVPLASRDDLAAELRGPRAAWIAEHDDPRGVPTFSSAHLESLEDVGAYEAVLEALGDEVTFLRVR